MIEFVQGVLFIIYLSWWKRKANTMRTVFHGKDAWTMKAQRLLVDESRPIRSMNFRAKKERTVFQFCVWSILWGLSFLLKVLKGVKNCFNKNFNSMIRWLKIFSRINYSIKKRGREIYYIYIYLHTTSRLVCKLSNFVILVPRH